MDAAALAGLCALLTHGAPATSLPAGVTCSAVLPAPVQENPLSLRDRVATREARDAIARVTYAEAANQGDSGLAAVVYTILNRVQDGRWGASVDAVLNARAQFEPVLRAGGDWRRLPAVSAAFQARIDTILNLALDGRLPDLTNGARYFQNPQIVAARAKAGTVSASLVNFGGATPSVQIGDHSFYSDAGAGRGGGTAVQVSPRNVQATAADQTMFVAEKLAEADQDVDPSSRAFGPAAGDPSQALFVDGAGRITSSRP